MARVVRKFEEDGSYQFQTFKVTFISWQFLILEKKYLFDPFKWKFFPIG